MSPSPDTLIERGQRRSDQSFVTDVYNTDPERLADYADGEGVVRERQEEMRRRLERVDIDTGFGYANSGLNDDLYEKEVAVAAAVAGIFEQRDAEPLLLHVDDFYQYATEQYNTASISNTVRRFDGETESRYSLILSGFASSDIFDVPTLEDVPDQHDAGLYPRQMTEVGRQFLDFATHDCADVLSQLMDGEKSDSQDSSRLLTTTALLLQDRNKWQPLWYEGEDEGTPLFIVAPGAFHNAMNRLNKYWSNGPLQYSYRAGCSLGAQDDSLTEDLDNMDYVDIGLSEEEFASVVKQHLDV